nr:DUF746 domain-containing protein [Burkholderia ubonensis]
MSRSGRADGQPVSDIAERATAWLSRLLRLDPSGQWERRMRLGGRLTELESGPLAFDEIGSGEDTRLTALLIRELDKLNSTSLRPPPCSTSAAAAARRS